MIQVIGVKRILIVLFLVAINAALAAALYLYLMPESQKTERTLRSTRSQVSQMRSDAAELRTDIAQIEEKKNYYNNLEKLGFRSDQNRLVARRRIMDIQQYSKVLKAGYQIGSANVVQNSILQDSNQAILESEIAVDIDAMDDVDFYSFIYWLQNTFPGHVVVDQINLTRVQDVNDITIRRIGSGDPVTMVRGKIIGRWRTVVPQDVVNASNIVGEGF